MRLRKFTPFIIRRCKWSLRYREFGQRELSASCRFRRIATSTRFVQKISRIPIRRMLRPLNDMRSVRITWKRWGFLLFRDAAFPLRTRPKVSPWFWWIANLLTESGQAKIRLESRYKLANWIVHGVLLLASYGKSDTRAWRSRSDCSFICLSNNGPILRFHWLSKAITMRYPLFRRSGKQLLPSIRASLYRKLQVWQVSLNRTWRKEKPRWLLLNSLRRSRFFCPP